MSTSYDCSAIVHGKTQPSVVRFPMLKLYPRYLYEIGDYEVCGRVVETAIGACEDRTSWLYARLVDTAGSRYYAMNRLSDCRTSWETALNIRREHLPHDDTFSKSIAPSS